MRRRDCFKVSEGWSTTRAEPCRVRGEQGGCSRGGTKSRWKAVSGRQSLLLTFTWSFMKPRHIVIERGSLKRLNVYSNRERGQQWEGEKKQASGPRHCGWYFFVHKLLKQFVRKNRTEEEKFSYQLQLQNMYIFKTVIVQVRDYSRKFNTILHFFTNKISLPMNASVCAP